MKKNNLRNWKIVNSYGLAQIPLLIGLLIMAVAVPVATKLVEQEQDTRNLASGCAADGETMYYGHPCCSGLVQTSCTGSGSYATCKCVKPATNPTSTPAMKSCTYRTCSNNSCVSRTTSVPSSSACPSSNCTSDSSCRPANTATPRPTSRPTAVPTSRPTTVPTVRPTATTCAKEGEKMYYGHPCCSGLVQTSCTGSGSYATCTCSKPATNPTSTPAMRSCTVRSCSSGKCVATNTSVPSNKACPPSNCTSDTSCQAVSTCQTCSPSSYPGVLPCSSVCPGGTYYIEGNVGVCGTKAQCAVTPTPIGACRTNGCTTKGSTSSCTINPGYPGVTPGTGTKTCNLNVFSNCLTWSECKVSINPTAPPAQACANNGCNTLGSTASCTINPGYAGVTPGTGIKTCNKNWFANCLTWSECRVSTAQPTAIPTVSLYQKCSGPSNTQANCPSGAVCLAMTGGYYCVPQNPPTGCTPGTVKCENEGLSSFEYVCNSSGYYDKNRRCDDKCKTDGSACVSFTRCTEGATRCNASSGSAEKCIKVGDITVWEGSYCPNGCVSDADGAHCSSVPAPTGTIVPTWPVSISIAPSATTNPKVTNPPSKCKVCANGKKAKGDANCDGKIDVNDRTIWSTDFRTDGGNRVSKNTWNADFNCDGFVDVNDRTIWSSNFTI